MTTYKYKIPQCLSLLCLELWDGYNFKDISSVFEHVKETYPKYLVKLNTFSVFEPVQ